MDAVIHHLKTPPDKAPLREYLPLAREGGAVVVVGEMAVTPRVVVFDLDATLIACEFVDELAARRGVAHLTRELTARAMKGGMDFRESYLRRIELLRGMPVGEIERLIEELPLAPGAERAIAALKAKGVRTAIITGGYARLGRAIQRRLGIDALYATELEERDGCLTGRLAGHLTGSLAGDLLDGEGKVAALGDFCAQCGLTPRDAVAVGDGANDLKMLAAAGLAVLYTSAPPAGIEPHPLDAILERCL